MAVAAAVSLSHSLCQYAVASGEPLIIEDARDDPVIRNNLAVTQSGVIAYAGIPLITPDSHVLGTLCVFDSKPRHWTQEQIENLRSLASSVISTIMYRAAARASQPAAFDEAGAPAPDQEGVSQLEEAGDVLAEAVAEYLRSLNWFDECLQDPKRRGQEAECQSALLDAEERMRQATQEFQRRLGELSEKPDTPKLKPALELLQACVAYFNAQNRRSEVMKHFTKLQAALSEVEREVMLVTKAEHAIRLASQMYELRRE
ncbi:GAF domain-containing protein [Microvirga aerilata]|uniref:GAF domain-containing protein n=1 Tax=Microvirga aerilata TaxID=670292 RepID=UPI00363A28B5